MESLESRLQKRMHASLYALIFLTALLGLSVLLEGCSDKFQVKKEYQGQTAIKLTLPK